MPSILDIDECTAGKHNCDQNADCQDNDGSFTCTCNGGYTGDGVTCAGKVPFAVRLSTFGQCNGYNAGSTLYLSIYSMLHYACNLSIKNTMRVVSVYTLYKNVHTCRVN